MNSFWKYISLCHVCYNDQEIGRVFSGAMDGKFSLFLQTKDNNNNMSDLQKIRINTEIQL